MIFSCCVPHHKAKVDYIHACVLDKCCDSLLDYMHDVHRWMGGWTRGARECMDLLWARGLLCLWMTSTCLQRRHMVHRSACKQAPAAHHSHVCMQLPLQLLARSWLLTSLTEITAAAIAGQHLECPGACKVVNCCEAFVVVCSLQLSCCGSSWTWVAGMGGTTASGP